METQLTALLKAIAIADGCTLYSPAGEPPGEVRDRLPSDMRDFYRLCGGLLLFEHSDYPVRFVPPSGVVQANPVIVGGAQPDDISDEWYIVAEDTDGEYFTIDTAPARKGRCYDSFSDCHGIPGSCPVIAASFTELLQRFFDNGGQYWYFKSKDFESLGDAYD